MQPGHEKIRQPQDPAGRFLKNAPEKFSCPWARAPALRTQNGLPPRQRTMSRVPPSLFPRRLSSAFRTNVSQSRILLPCSGICRQMPELFFARRTARRGTRRPELCGDFFGELRAPKTKTPRTTCERSSPGQADARARGRPALRGRSIAEPAHDAVRSDAPVHGGRLLRRCCRAFEPDDAPAQYAPFPGKLLPESCPEPEKAAGPSRKHEGPVAPGARRFFRTGDRSRAQSSSKPCTAKTAAPAPCGRGSLGIHEKRRNGACRAPRTRQSEERRLRARGSACRARAPRPRQERASRALCPGRRFFRYLPSYSQRISPVLSVP